LTVLHRIFASGSDRAAERWQEDYRLEGIEKIELQHLYRAMAFLGEPLEPADQGMKAPRCVKDKIEEALFDRRRDLFSQVDLVFFDTTSIYFEGEGGSTLGAHGYSKDHRPDLKQMVVGLALDVEGRPLCSEFWPGNTSDATTLIPVIQRMRQRFRISEICIVADRGMISDATLQALESMEPPVRYILGARMRRQKEVGEKGLSRHAHWQEVTPERQAAKDPSPLKVKEVWVEDRRYVVCLNEEERRKDARDRETIVKSLRQQIRRGDKALVGNKGYRRYLKVEKGTHFSVDEEPIRLESRYDGIWVLRTNTDLDAETIAHAYKCLLFVETAFRPTQSILETRPIYHKCDQTIRGHVFCRYLALLLKWELETRMKNAGLPWEWAEVIRGLDTLQEVEVQFQDQRFILRSQIGGHASQALRAAGVAAPLTLRRVER
jgi:transposase